MQQKANTKVESIITDHLRNRTSSYNNKQLIRAGDKILYRQGLYQKTKVKKTDIYPIQLPSGKIGEYYKMSKLPKDTMADKYAQAWFNEQDHRVYNASIWENISESLSEMENIKSTTLLTIPSAPTSVNQMNNTANVQMETVEAQESSSEGSFKSATSQPNSPKGKDKQSFDPAVLMTQEELGEGFRVLTASPPYSMIHTNPSIYGDSYQDLFYDFPTSTNNLYSPTNVASSSKKQPIYSKKDTPQNNLQLARRLLKYHQIRLNLQDLDLTKRNIVNKIQDIEFKKAWKNYKNLYDAKSQN